MNDHGLTDPHFHSIFTLACYFYLASSIGLVCKCHFDTLLFKITFFKDAKEAQLVLGVLTKKPTFLTGNFSSSPNILTGLCFCYHHYYNFFKNHIDRFGRTY